jgi:Flp pilus assembly protein TadB
MTAMPSVDMLLIAGRAVFLVFSFVVAAITFTAWRRSAQRQTQHVLEQSEALLQRQAALEVRLEAIGTALRRLDERSERQGQSPGHVPGYQIAIRLAKSGASRDELMSSCGLSQGEAELVQRLHGAASGATPAHA